MNEIEKSKIFLDLLIKKTEFNIIYKINIENDLEFLNFEKICDIFEHGKMNSKELIKSIKNFILKLKNFYKHDLIFMGIISDFSQIFEKNYNLIFKTSISQLFIDIKELHHELELLLSKPPNSELNILKNIIPKEKINKEDLYKKLIKLNENEEFQSLLLPIIRNFSNIKFDNTIINSEKDLKSFFIIDLSSLNERELLILKKLTERF